MVPQDRLDAQAIRAGRRWRRWRLAVLVGSAVLLATGLLAAPAVGQGGGPPTDGPGRGAAASQLPGPPQFAGYEIWVPDQSTNLVHIYDEQLALVDTIDLGAHGIVRPHMIEFDSRYRYAFVANTVSGNIAVIRTHDREVVAVVATGAGSHMVAVTPDDSAVWVAAIGAQRFSEIPLDLDNPDPTFAVDRVIDTAAALSAAPFDYPSAGAVCHQYTADSRFAYLTFGPGPAQGGLVVVDLETAEFVKFFDPQIVKANCGLALTGDGRKMYANWGGDVATGTEGEWYVFDTSTHELVQTDSTRGVDAHGVRLTPDGRWVWMVNRATSNAIIINPRTDRVVRELPFVGKSPDILDFSPDGRYAFVSLRGPNPLTGPHAIAGETPGFAVLHIPSGRLLSVVELPPVHDAGGLLLNDPHGIGVRVLD
jgi:DNA-binding beta-propeller fold protein YncE